MKAQIIEDLRSIVGEDWVVDSIDQIRDYLVDETAQPSCPEPSTDVVVVKPARADEISEVLKLANKEAVPVVPRGGGTGLCAAAVPTEPSILVSLERLDSILEVDENNLTITCEAGVTLGEMIERAERTESLFFPLRPGDQAAQIGGLVAANAGGARAVQHGVMRNHIKGIEVVLPTGEITELGGKVLKNNTGYDLMHLIIGSEGTLGIITKVTLRLYPRPRASFSLIIPYEKRSDAIRTVPEILQHGIIPLAIEYVERDLIEESAEHLGEKWPAKEGNAYLYIIVTGADEDALYAASAEIDQICQSHGALGTLVAEKKREQDRILDIRGNIYTSLKADTADILDVTVPLANIGRLMDKVDEIAEEFDATIPMYGHAGDGNLHPHIMKIDGEAPPYLDEIREEIYKKAIELGGFITGEHGIGKTRIKNLPLLDEKQVELMRGIKKVFDPNN
ncbi:MAG: FAD-binding oxidoreductase, partial [Chloroflexota bacterium]|nr:FAD-binding oxidoreductase [Chloroflexota bacterium]